MNAILYLLRKNVRNAILDTLRHPMKLIVYLLIGASIVFAVVRGFTFSETIEDMLDIRILYGAYMALLFFISIPIMLKGLSTGSTFFTMGDVNNLFVAPVSPKKLLVYGIGKQLAASMFLVVCFSAYGSFAIRMFELTVIDSVLLVLGILLMLVMVQMVTLLIFCVCSARPGRAAVLRFFIYALPVYALAAVAVYMFGNGMTLDNLYAAISQNLLQFVPIVGWVHGLIFGLISHQTMNVLIYAGLLLISCIVSILIFRLTSLDYYEDVLQRAESYFEFKEHIRTGKVSDSDFLGSSRVRLRKQGIRKGKGASAIFYKHLREGQRRTRLMFFNINTIVLVGVAAVIGLSMKGFFPSPYRTTVIYLAVTVICSYIQFFFSAAGDWVKELNKPYIFLIPDHPVKKLIMAGATSIIKPFIDGAITYAVLWLLVGGFWPDVIVSALVYGSFGCIYIASNILAQRIVGISGNRGVFITFYMGFMVILMVPGILAGIFLLSSVSGYLMAVAATIIGLPVLVWNLVISFIIFLLCKNLMNNIE